MPIEMALHSLLGDRLPGRGIRIVAEVHLDHRQRNLADR
jgi:hypothetical protein